MQRAHAADRKCPVYIDGKVIREFALEHRHATHSNAAGRTVPINLNEMPVVVPALRLRAGNAATIRGVAVVE